MRTLEIIACCLLATAALSATAKSRNTAPATLSRIAEVNMGLAQSYLEANSLVDALDRAKRAVAADPNFGETHAVLGMVYSRIGDTVNAGKEFDVALKLSPSSGSILNAHAAWLCEQGQFDKADSEFRQALADPFYTTPAQANFNAGKCAQKASHWVPAESYLRIALNAAPQDPRVLQALAEVKFAQGQWLEARAFVQRLLSVDVSAEALELAARIEDGAGDRVAAARFRQQLSLMLPQQP